MIVVLLLGLVTDYSVFFLSESRRRLRRGQTPARGGPRGHPPDGADRAHRGPDRRGGHRRARGRQAGLLPRLRTRARGHDPDRAASSRSRSSRRCSRCSARACSAGRRSAEAAERRHEDTDTHEIERARKSVERRSSRGAPRGSRLALTRPSPRCAGPRARARSRRRAAGGCSIARIASARPVALPIAIVCIALLALLAPATRATELGLGFIGALPADNEVRQAADAAAEGFARRACCRRPRSTSSSRGSPRGATSSAGSRT